MESKNGDYVLYTYFRSSCAGRVRIALNLKNIPYKPVFVNLLKGDQSSADYEKINPSRVVPTLEITKPDGSFFLTQSVAILEYLEEQFPNQNPLLPPTSDPESRASVRALVNIIAADTQPVTNLRILQRVDALGGSRADWSKELQEMGLKAYERLVKDTAGKFSVGDRITLADICLVPAIWGALRWGVNMEAFPTVWRIYEELSKEPAVQEAHWSRQGDTPEELKQPLS